MGKREKETAFTLALPRGSFWAGKGWAQSRMRRTLQPLWLKYCSVPSQGSAQAQGLLFPPAKSDLSRPLPLTPQRFPCVLSTALVAVTQL